MSECACGHHHHQHDADCVHDKRQPGQVTLTGRLVCADMAEMLTVLDHADAHIAASRAEPGCLSFDLAQTDDPLVFTFAERFTDAGAFRAHQDRTRASDWGQATAAIARADRDFRSAD